MRQQGVHVASGLCETTYTISVAEDVNWCQLCTFLQIGANVVFFGLAILFLVIFILW
jgi:hypothetical protein